MFLALAGGVGGAKLALGLTQVLPPDELMIVVNTGDDFYHLGLRICPDIDTVTYTLAGIANPDTGWGLRDETWNFMDFQGRLGADTWFRLGDKDLATHLERTRRLGAGETLSSITALFAKKLGIRHPVVPATDNEIMTIVKTPDGPLGFQEYFVRLKCEPVATGFDFSGAAKAQASQRLEKAFMRDDIEAVIICPSNPYVSIAPILAVPSIKRFLTTTRIPVVVVSPIIGGQAIKGPAAKMMKELGVAPSSIAVSDYYSRVASALVIDTADAHEAEPIRAHGMRVCVTNTVMTTNAEKTQLAEDVIAFARSLRG